MRSMFWMIGGGVLALAAGFVIAGMLAVERPAPTPPIPDELIRSTLQSVHGQAKQALRDCDSFSVTFYQACKAYVIDATLEARIMYCIFGKSTSPAWSGFARRRLQLFYRGQALRYVQLQTKSWPSDLAHVQIPQLSINNIVLSADNNQATITTHESWHVVSGVGSMLLNESNRQYTIVMRRTGGRPSPQWVVTTIR